MISDKEFEQAAAYALGALDAGEVPAFEAAMGRSDELRREVEALKEAAATMALAAPTIPVPAGLRDRVLAVAQSPPAVVTHTARARPERRTSRPVVALVPWFALAAAIVGIVLVQGRLTTERALTLAAAAQRDSIARVLASRDSLLALVTGPDVETIQLVSAGKPPTARLYWNRARREVMLTAYALPPAPAGRTYQLWGIAAGNAKPVGLGTFNTGANGQGRLTANVPEGLTIAVGAVTEEPAGGSVQPTTTPFLVGKLSGTR